MPYDFSDPLMNILGNSAENVSTSQQGMGSTNEAVPATPESLLTRVSSSVSAASLDSLPVLRSENDPSNISSAVFLDASYASAVNTTPRLGPIDQLIPGQATIDSTLSDYPKNGAIPKSTDPRFIPIMIQTEFSFKSPAGGSKKQQVYILFDSTPESIDIMRAANYAPQNFPGRPEPIWIYSNTNSPQFSLTGKFFASSVEEHITKLQYSEQLLGLVLPSKYNFVPTPINITIGEWKTFRCIVNSVTVKHMGPWTLKGNTPKGQSSQASIKSHSPRYFEATLQMTIISPSNKVSYIEDIVEQKGVTNFFSNDKDALASYKSQADTQFLQSRIKNTNNGATSKLIDDLRTRYT